MTSERITRFFRGRTILPAALLAALAAFAPGTSQANTTADATILNVVTVEYADAGGLATFQATASATVTINLVESALAATNPPTAADPGGTAGLTCDALGPYASGSTRESLYALTATANGDDNYLLSMANTPTDANNVTVAYRILTATGAVESLNPADRDFGSAVPVGVKDATTLYFPGGSLAGFADGDIVLVEYAAGKVAYLVDGAPVVGNAASHTNLGGVVHSDVGATTAEVQGELKLKAFPVTGITINGAAFDVGSDNAPAFTTTAPVVGSVVGEMVLVKISVTATANVHGANGSVAYTLTATDGSNPETIPCSVSFEGVGLEIRKDVRSYDVANTTWRNGGAFTAAATGNPGDILEYRVTVTNTGGAATAVEVTDAVPAYTTLVGTAYGSSPDYFARLTDNAATPNTVNVTPAAGGEAQPLAPDAETGFGGAAGTAAGEALTFFLGNGSAAAAGGSLPYCSDGINTTAADCATATEDWITQLTIIYQVTID